MWNLSSIKHLFYSPQKNHFNSKVKRKQKTNKDNKEKEKDGKRKEGEKQ